MIKFFRKIRRKLLTENKLSKYLVYAIGEIFLVVIGILIALQLNIWNETRKTEQEIATILGEVQKDLGANIQQSKELFDYYSTRDSIITMVLNDELTAADYRSKRNKRLIYAAIDAHHLKIHDKGYRNLSEKLDEVPDSFQELIEPLNEIYTYDKYEIDKFDKRLDEITDRLMDDLAANKPWYHEVAQNNVQINDTIINYYLNDPYYKNALTIYSIAAENLMFHVELFNENAVNSYKRIQEITGHPEELPHYIPQNLMPMSEANYNEILGKYHLISWGKFGETEMAVDDPHTMRLGKDCLELVDDRHGNITRLFFKSETLLYTVDEEVHLERDDDNRLIGMTLKGPLYELKFEKSK